MLEFQYIKVFMQAHRSNSEILPKRSSSIIELFVRKHLCLSKIKKKKASCEYTFSCIHNREHSVQSLCIGLMNKRAHSTRQGAAYQFVYDD